VVVLVLVVLVVLVLVVLVVGIKPKASCSNIEVYPPTLSQYFIKDFSVLIHVYLVPFLFNCTTLT
jgi:hypothetical protein